MVPVEVRKENWNWYLSRTAVVISRKCCVAFTDSVRIEITQRNCETRNDMKIKHHQYLRLLRKHALKILRGVFLENIRGNINETWFLSDSWSFQTTLRQAQYLHFAKQIKFTDYESCKSDFFIRRIELPVWETCQPEELKPKEKNWRSVVNKECCFIN